MISQEFLEMLRRQFDGAITKVTDKGESILVHPEISGLSAMFTAALMKLQMQDFKEQMCNLSLKIVEKRKQYSKKFLALY